MNPTTHTQVPMFRKSEITLLHVDMACTRTNFTQALPITNPFCLGTLSLRTVTIAPNTHVTKCCEWSSMWHIGDLGQGLVFNVESLVICFDVLILAYSKTVVWSERQDYQTKMISLQQALEQL